MEVQSAQDSFLRTHLDKENKTCEEEVRELNIGKDNARGLTIRVTTNEHPASPSEDAEPLSPSKRFKQTNNAALPLPAQPERASSDNSSDSCRTEAKQQICFDYTKGVCKRGAACKYSHDVEEIVRVNSQERGVCFDFLRNSCQRGLLCRFSHDLTSIVVQDQGVPQTQKPIRKNAPICYDFVKGVCKRDDCRYSHDIFSIIRGKHANAGPEICYDFTRGKCNRGSACRYSHDVPTADSLPSLQTDTGMPFRQSLLLVPFENMAALAVQHAQAAAAAAVAMEVSRRQSAPGCLQAAADPLFAWLSSLQPPLPSRLGDAANASQVALALQLQSHWLMQLQAQAATNLLQPQVPPALSNWEQAAQKSLQQCWPANLSVSAADLRPPHTIPPSQVAPQLPPTLEPRRHTHDGTGSASRLPAEMLMQLQELSLRQNLLEAEQQMKLGPEPAQQGLMPRDRLSGESTIGAEWHLGQSPPSLSAGHPPLPLKRQQMVQHSLSLPQPTCCNRTVEHQHKLPDLGRSASHSLPPSEPQASRQSSGLGGQQRMPFLLRPHLSSPVTRSEQASLKPSLSDASWPQLQGGEPSTSLQDQALQRAMAPVQSISFEDRPQAIARDQLALFQEIWRQ